MNYKQNDNNNFSFFFCFLLKDENIKTKHFDVDKFKEGEMPLTTSIAQTILEVWNSTMKIVFFFLLFEKKSHFSYF